MTSFLLLLSFLIHLILFITIYHLYEKTKRDKDEQAEQLAKMLTSFMNDIQLENSKLEQKIHENELRKSMKYDYPPPIPNQHEPRDRATESYVPNMHDTTANYETNRQRDYVTVTGTTEQDRENIIETVDQAEKVFTGSAEGHQEQFIRAAEGHQEDTIETSFEGQVLQLHREGKNVDEIAKQLNRGKTEVDLLIKLNRKVNK